MARRRLVAWSVLVAIAGFATHHVIAAQGFTEIFSGFFDGNAVEGFPPSIHPRFVNDNGAVAGTTLLRGSSNLRSFVWTLTDGLVDIGTLGGPSATVVDLNNNRVAIGNSASAAGGPSRAFIWTNEDGMADLGTAGGSFAVAADVNDNDWVVGHSASANDVGERAFLWSPQHGLTDLCQQFVCNFFEPGAKNGATHVNNNGHVVGYAFDGIFDMNGTPISQAALWDTHTGTFTAFFHDPENVFHCCASVADIITDSGWVAGRIGGPDQSPPGADAAGFLRSPSGELFHFGRVTDLNENGWAVAWGTVPGQAGTKGFLWNPETETDVDIGAVEADAPLFLLGDGIVVGHTVDEDGYFHAFRWSAQGGRTEIRNQPTDQTLALDHAAGRVVGFNFREFDQQFFVWDGAFETLATDVSVFDGLAIGANGFIAGTPHSWLFKIWAPSNVFSFTGFFQPVDNAPVLNTAKAGAKIPVRFSLDGDHGLEVLAFGYPVSKPIACTSGEESPVEETVTVPPGEPALSYQSGSDQYRFTWTTQKSWGNTCRELTFKFIDGTVKTAVFKFK